MPIFEAIGEILRGLTVNENATEIDEKQAEKEAEAIVMKYNQDIEKKEKEVSSTYISLEEEKESIVPEAKVDEALADKTAKEKAIGKARTQENQMEK